MLQCMQTCACYVGSGRTAIANKGETSARGREVRRVKASAWNFRLAMRIISRIHVDDLKRLGTS